MKQRDEPDQKFYTVATEEQSRGKNWEIVFFFREQTNSLNGRFAFLMDETDCTNFMTRSCKMNLVQFAIKGKNICENKIKNMQLYR